MGTPFPSRSVHRKSPEVVTWSRRKKEHTDVTEMRLNKSLTVFSLNWKHQCEFKRILPLKNIIKSISFVCVFIYREK